MEVTTESEVTILVHTCLAELDAVEAEFIYQCYLAEPQKTLKAFATERHMGPKELADLRSRASTHLRDAMTARNVRSMSDLM